MAKGLSRRELLAFAKAGAQKRLEELQVEISAIRAAFGIDAARMSQMAAAPKRTSKRRKLSAAGRANIVAAQKARWATQRSEAAKPIRRNRKMSAAGRKKIAAAAKLRWARWRAAKKK